jgi:hypothetical protein
MTEKQFIIQLAVDQFNAQYNRSMLHTDFDARSIEPNQFSILAYEVFTVRLDDYVRLRMYLEYGPYDNLGPYRLEVDGSTGGVGVLGDEVYVTSGQVDSYYRESGLYRFGLLNVDTATWNILLDEMGNEWITEATGEFFILETGA